MKYTFRCNTCKQEFMQEFTYDEYTQKVKFRCPYCNDFNSQRIIQPVSIIYKGEGFTKTVKEEE